MINHYRQMATRIFAAHAGNGPAVQGYGATAWRDWLICGTCHGLWFAVPKSDPTGRPKAYRCSLAQAKANLLAGY